jgi:tetratricopeptide (TPR) repeat protein
VSAGSSVDRRGTATLRAARRLSLILVLGVVTAMGGADAAPRSRVVLVLPYQNVTPGGADGWLGEGIAETLGLAARTTAVLLPIDAGRVAQAVRVAGIDLTATPVERGAAALARALRADVVFYGEYQRTPDGGVSLVPKLLDGGRSEGQALEGLVGPGDRVLETQADILPIYTKALKLGLKADELARMVAAARPTTNLTAFEAYAKGRRSYLRGGQEGFEGAAELFARAVEIDPAFAVAHYQLGLAHLGLGNRRKGVAQFRAAMQIDPMLPEPVKVLGDLAMRSTRPRYDEAADAYQKALTLRPHYAEAQVGLGDAKAAKGDHEGAIGHYQKALGSDPLNAQVYVSLGKIYHGEKGLYYEAVDAYKKAIELDPHFLDARMGLGEIYEEKGLYRDAIGEYRKVIEADPRHMEAHYNLAQAYEKVDVKEAVAQWERYIALASPVPSAAQWVDVARQHLRKLLEKEKAP